MMKIDAHQHFWQYNPVRDAWITSEMASIRQDFTPEDLWPLLDQYDIDGCVAVQSHQSEKENDALLFHADVHDFIKGVVGWLDLQSENLPERLAYYSSFSKMKGLRHVLQGEQQRDFMLNPAFLKGIRHLEKYDLTYDILILPDQLPFIAEFVQSFPQQRFVIDHLAKPEIKNAGINSWQKHMTEIAKHENVYCKVSGMVTEADWNNWKALDFKPYLDVVFEAFGTKRLMFGSDWPVCNVAGGYHKTITLIQDLTSFLSTDEQSLFFGKNAVDFYNLDSSS
jgi:L-fuconolactonase